MRLNIPAGALEYLGVTGCHVRRRTVECWYIRWLFRGGRGECALIRGRVRKQMHLVLNRGAALVDGRQCCWREGSMGDMCEGS